MNTEKLIVEVNNVEWDGEGNPLYSFSQMKNAMSDYAILFANWIGDRPLPEYSKSTNEWRWWNNKNKGYDYATTEKLLEMFVTGQSEVV